MKLIDADILREFMDKIKRDGDTCPFVTYNNDAYRQLVEYIDEAPDLSVKEDVDLEKELDAFYGMYRDENGETRDLSDGNFCTDWKEDCNPDFEIRFARHFYEFGRKAKDLSPIDSKELDEAAEEWCKENHKGIALAGDKKSHYLADGLDAFIAGAKWQARHSLTWEDIRRIIYINEEYSCEFQRHPYYTKEYSEEVLKRFNASKLK